MELKFSALSQKPDEQGQESAERQMFDMDMKSERNERGQPMVAAGPLGGAIKDASPAAPATGVAEGVEGVADRVASEPAVEQDVQGQATAAGGVVETEAHTQPVQGESATESPEASSDSAASPEIDPELEKNKKEEEEKDLTQAAAPELDPFAALLQLSAGKRAADEVKLEGVSSKAVSMFSAASAEEDAAEAEDAESLVEMVKRGVEKSKRGGANETPAEPIAPDAAGPATVVGVAPVAVGVGAGKFSTTVGGVLGRAAGEVIATPFIALSSAAKHLTQRFGKPMSAVPSGPASASRSMSASMGVSPAILNTLETITQWKCDRIEKAAHDVSKTASALTGTEEFVVWEDKLRKLAEEQNQPVTDMVARMHEDESLSDLKAGMDGLWQAHPEKVAAYRKASEDFVRNINTVVKEFPNSDEGIKERVANAMKDVEETTQLLPGFGQDVGEYQRTLAERVREVAKIIAEFVRQLVAKLSGRAPSANELTV